MPTEAQEQKIKQVIQNYLQERRDVLTKTGGNWSAADAVAYRYLNREFHTKEFRPGMGLYFMKALIEKLVIRNDRAT